MKHPRSSCAALRRWELQVILTMMVMMMLLLMMMMMMVMRIMMVVIMVHLLVLVLMLIIMIMMMMMMMTMTMRMSTKKRMMMAIMSSSPVAEDGEAEDNHAEGASHSCRACTPEFHCLHQYFSFHAMTVVDLSPKPTIWQCLPRGSGLSRHTAKCFSGCQKPLSPHCAV